MQLVIFLTALAFASGAINSGGDGFNSLIGGRPGHTPESYDKRLRPYHGGRPLKVYVSAHVQTGYWERHKLTTVIYVRTSWRDDRLAYSTPGQGDISLGSEYTTSIWTPDLFVPTSLEVEKFQDEVMIKLTPEGDILKSERMRLVTPCRSNVARLSEQNPHHTNCSVPIESFRYSTDDVALSWTDRLTAITTSEDRSMKIHRVSWEETTQRMSSGSYSQLIIYLDLETQPLYQLETCVHECFEGGRRDDY